MRDDTTARRVAVFAALGEPVNFAQQRLDLFVLFVSFERDVFQLLVLLPSRVEDSLLNVGMSFEFGFDLLEKLLMLLLVFGRFALRSSPFVIFVSFLAKTSLQQIRKI